MVGVLHAKIPRPRMARTWTRMVKSNVEGDVEGHRNARAERDVQNVFKPDPVPAPENRTDPSDRRRPSHRTGLTLILSLRPRRRNRRGVYAYTPHRRHCGSAKIVDGIV